jgi:integrase
MRHDSSATAWHELADKIAPEVLGAPKTWSDKNAPRNRPTVDSRTVKFLARNVVDEPWANHLALAAAVLTAYNRDAQTVYRTIQQIHLRLKAIFITFKLKSMSDWHPDKHIPLYLAGKIAPGDSLGTRIRFVSIYAVTSNILQQWMTSLPVAAQRTYQPFTLPLAYNEQFAVAQYYAQFKQQGQAKRKVATDAIVPHFADLRAEAHRRHNKLARLLAAYHHALDELKKGSCALPFQFSFEEESERLHFRIWDYRTFVLSHPEGYSADMIRRAKARTTVFSEAANRLFLELTGVEALTNRQPSDGYWFVDLLRQGLLGNPFRAYSNTAEYVAKREWSRQWGYIDRQSKSPGSPFYTYVAGLLNHEMPQNRVRKIHSVTPGVVIPVQSLYDAATFGLLAISLFTTTGMRSNEALQIRLSADCFFRVSKAAPPGATDQSPRIRYGFRLIPKGERRDVPQDYFIGQETYRIVVTTAKMLKAHYGLQDGEALPLIPFAPDHHRAHRFGHARYLFQYRHRHISDAALIACMRFLLHGMVFLDKEGKNVILTPHLLRHAFATYAAHVEHVPGDVIGGMMHHKNLEITEYYKQATDSIIADWQDQFLDSLAAHINLDEAILRAPEALQEQLKSALDRTGTVHQTLGGDCTLHAICPIHFACVGCAANVPDPTKRYQIEREQQHAAAEVDLATREGRYPEAQRWRQHEQRCATFLKEMDQIEAYRKDAARGVTIRIEDIQ